MDELMFLVEEMMWRYPDSTDRELARRLASWIDSTTILCSGSRCPIPDTSTLMDFVHEIRQVRPVHPALDGSAHWPL